MSRPEPGDPIDFDGPMADEAIEVAPRIWWVGDVIADDPFQCHAYLVEAGPSSVLIDPGSSLTIDATLTKIRQVVDTADIATVVLHHSDPDCADALHRLGDELRPDVRILTEWRSELLLKHLTPRFPIDTIEDRGWRLALDGERELRFLLTPYLHFPGAFVSFETSTRALFTADLFGGFNRGRRLYATSPDDFEDLRSFHEHYMPSREILMAGLASIRSTFGIPPLLLPQHGYVIPTELVAPMFDALWALECGVMLTSRSDTHLARMLSAASAVREIEEVLRSDRRVAEMLDVAGRIARRVLPIGEIGVTREGPDGVVHRYDVAHPDGIPAPPISSSDMSWQLPNDHGPSRLRLVVERTSSTADVPPEVSAMFLMLLPHMAAVVARLVDLEIAEQERTTWQRSATVDALTGLKSRRTLESARFLDQDSAVLMLDIDHFKEVNDNWGHPVGDEVLRRVAAAVLGALRATDRAIRYGGEEILVIAGLADGTARADPAGLGERLRQSVEAVDVDDLTPGRHVTVSVGVAEGASGSAIEEAVGLADAALYRAKQTGRNRVVLDVGGGALIDVGEGGHTARYTWLGADPLAAAVGELVARSPVPMWAYERETLRFIEVNQAAIAAYGWSRDEFLSMRISDIRPLEDVDTLHTHIANRTNTAYRDSGGWRHRTKDGRLLNVRITSHIASAGDREIVIVAALDQTSVVDAARRTAAQFDLGRLADQLDIAGFLESVANVIGDALESPHAELHLVDDSDEGHVTVASATKDVLDRIGAESGERVRIGSDSVWSEVIRLRVPHVANDAARNERLARDFGVDHLVRSAVVPIERSGRVAALVAVCNKPGLYTDDDIETARALGDLAVHMLERKRAREETRAALERYEQATWASVGTLARATEARDPYTAGHQRRVGILASHIGLRLGLDHTQIAGLLVAGYLHDLGKIAIPAEILTKPGRLSDLEMRLVQTHSLIGAEILDETDFPWPVRAVVLQHHERLDGSGYPAGLFGDEICLEARVVAVADVVDAMTSMRPYRSALGLEAAIDEISAQRGLKFDPAVVDAAIAVLDEFNGIPDEAADTAP